MDVKELRVGNYFDLYGSVAQLHPTDFKKWCKDFEFKDFKPIKLTENWLLDFGFKKIAHFTIQNSMILEIGGNKFLSFGGLGTGNEMIFLCERNNEDENKIDDLIGVHNYDYNGFMHVHQLQNLYFALTQNELTKKSQFAI